MTSADINQLIESLFAPWVQALDLKLKSDLSDFAAANSGQTPIIFTLPITNHLRRNDHSGGKSGGGTLCGQALSAAADTVSVLGLAIYNNGFRECTTTDLSIRFMRPVIADCLELHVYVLSSGRRMAVTEVEAKLPGNDKVFAKASCAFAYLTE